MKIWKFFFEKQWIIHLFSKNQNPFFVVISLYEKYSFILTSCDFLIFTTIKFGFKNITARILPHGNFRTYQYSLDSKIEILTKRYDLNRTLSTIVKNKAEPTLVMHN